MKTTNFWEGKVHIYGLNSPVIENTWALNFLSVPGSVTPNFFRIFKNNETQKDTFEQFIKDIKEKFQNQGIKDGEIVYIQYFHTDKFRKTIIQKNNGDKKIIINSFSPFNKNTVNIV